MGLDRPTGKVEKKQTELTGYKLAQHIHFLRAKIEEADAKEAGSLPCSRSRQVIR